MAEYIDANRLLDDIEITPFEDYGDYETAKAVILRQPSADVVEVVRCKDCKNADEYNHCTRLSIWNKPDDYCSYGERRTDEIN